MKNYIFLLFIILPVMVMGKGSCLSGLYLANNIADNAVCYLDLSKSGQYVLAVDVYSTEDITRSTVLSYGTYLIKGDKVLLKDICQNITMNFQITEKNKLKANHIFDFLKNITFVLNYGQDPDFISYLIKNKTNIAQERQKHKNIYKTQIMIGIGGNYINSWSAELNLSYGMTYTYKLNGLTVSSGTWDKSRYENELILYDTNLKHNFYILIEKQGLDCRLLPGYYTGVWQKQE
jgi:hypothetical protein